MLVFAVYVAVLWCHLRFEHYIFKTHLV